MPDIYVGTAGWSYKDWVPSFYPKHNSKSFDWLEFYSLYFNTVEVNASYYTYLNPRVVNGWISKVGESSDFLFTYKLHNDFTHNRVFGMQETKAVQYNLDLLKGAERFGGLLVQFPYSFACTDANVDYLRRLLERFEQYDKFVEVRHSSWNSPRIYEFLRSYNVTLCTIDQPSIGQSVEFAPVLTNDVLYIRCHGRNEEAWRASIENFGKQLSYSEQNARYEYLYSPGELLEIDRKLKELFDNVNKVFVIMNNHPKGDAVANAFELLHYLKGLARVHIPKTTVAAYPRLVKIAG